MTGLESLLEFDDVLNVVANAPVGRIPMADILLEWSAIAPAFKFGVFAAALCWVWGRVREPKTRDREIVITTVIAALLALFLARALALALPYRPRPMMRPELGLTAPPEFLEALQGWSAFPSDHAVLAFALATGLMLASRQIGRLALLHAAFFISFPRLYFGLHHFSDLLAGAALGAVITLVMNWRPVRVAVTRPFLALHAAAPGPFAAFGFLVLLETSIMFQDVRTLASMVLSTLGSGG